MEDLGPMEPYRLQPEPVIRRQDVGIVMPYEEFSVLVEPHVRMVSPEEYVQWSRTMQPGAEQRVAVGGYEYRSRLRQSVVPAEQTLAALDVVIRKDMITAQPGIRRYAVEHEKWELWQVLAHGVRVEAAHLLARHHEYLLAEQAGEADALYRMYSDLAAKEGGSITDPTHAIAREFARVHVTGR